MEKLHHLGKKYTTHTLRVSFATYLLEKGVNIREIQVMMGHSDIQTTQGYLRLKNTKLRETQKSTFWDFWGKIGLRGWEEAV